jgi:peroxiredoxin Q/BCP
MATTRKPGSTGGTRGAGRAAPKRVPSGTSPGGAKPRAVKPAPPAARPAAKGAGRAAAARPAAPKTAGATSGAVGRTGATGKQAAGGASAKSADRVTVPSRKPGPARAKAPPPASPEVVAPAPRAAASATAPATKRAPAKKPLPAAPTAPEVGPFEGDEAPAFTLHASGARTVSNASLAGQPYLLYFYPKADTPGCTKQACALQEALPQLGRLGLTVVGVSPDPMPPIEKFAKKYGLEFPLASDADHKVALAYGVWVEKSMYGKTYMGMERSSFLVGPDGRVVKVWRKVKPETHAAAVLEAMQALA